MGVSYDLYDLDVGSARLFLAVEELGSVSKAARRCGLTQPSATARISKLERQLGISLLERGPTGSALTDDGRHLLAKCSSLVAAAAELAADARALGASDRPTLSIAAPYHVLAFRLGEWIAETGLGDTELDLTECTTAQAAAALRSGDCTLAFLGGPSAPLGLRSEIIARDELVAVARPAHRWANRRRRISGPELAASELLLRAPGSGTRDVIEFALAEHGLGDRGQIRTAPSDNAARIGAINGEGIAILPSVQVRADLAADRLVTLPLRDLKLVQPIRIAWKGNQAASASARHLVSHLT